MTRKFSFAPGEYYHLYNRGFDKRQTFLDHRDHIRFLASLYLANSKEQFHPSDWPGQNVENIFNVIPISLNERLVDVGAYCLMPNHFHLLVREKEDKGISLMMQKLQTGYSMYFNKKYQRTGGLFESTFKAQHVDNDRYLNYLLAYIHLNPVKTVDPKDWEGKTIRNKETAKEFLNGYEYSSYHYYTGLPRSHNKILTPDDFPNYFQSRKDFDDFLNLWINFDDAIVEV
ncbi:MAG: transposase [Candidatus Vogelbacteria bacterium]|nr:transposase [Candidatus Vogelbacteria bacterium]